MVNSEWIKSIQQLLDRPDHQLPRSLTKTARDFQERLLIWLIAQDNSDF